MSAPAADQPKPKFSLFSVSGLTLALMVVTTLGGAALNYGVYVYRSQESETRIMKLEADRQTGIATNNEWKRATESRIATLEARAGAEDTRETSLESQLARIEEKLDRLILLRVK